MARENPLAGIDDDITDLSFAITERTKHQGTAQLAAFQRADQRVLIIRKRIRDKVAQANLLINELIELKQDKEKT